MPCIQNDQLRDVPVTKTIERRVFEIAYTAQEVRDILEDHARTNYADSMSDDVEIKVEENISWRGEEFEGFIVTVITDPALDDKRKKVA